MKVLIIGGGGREHALAWKVKQNKEVSKMYVLPGNAGLAQMAESVSLKMTNIHDIISFTKDYHIDLTVVGPEVPLSLGVVDFFQAHGLNIFGPRLSAAKIEWSKSFAKCLMKDNHIPTADYEIFSDAGKAKEYIRSKRKASVIKADGLASGKGAIVCPEVEDALQAIELIMEKKAFGQAGQHIVIEEFLTGEEASFLAFTDGETILPLSSAQDHKAVFDGDLGPNTGGMGAYSPTPVITQEIHDKIMDKIMMPTIEGLARLGTPYQGVLYAGLMIENNEPKVLEFNARFGDPETQPLLMRLDTDLISIIKKIQEKKLHQVNINWLPEAATCVVLASEGYPGPFTKGKVIQGLEDLADTPGVMVFHSGTLQQGKSIVTDGGRVLGVTALGKTITESISRAYDAVEKIYFEGMHYRKDIGWRALSRTF